MSASAAKGFSVSRRRTREGTETCRRTNGGGPTETNTPANYQHPKLPQWARRFEVVHRRSCYLGVPWAPGRAWTSPLWILRNVDRLAHPCPPRRRHRYLLFLAERVPRFK